MATFLPRVLSPALPSELISYILSQHKYPTTLVVCVSRADFVATFLEDAAPSRAEELPPNPDEGAVVAKGPPVQDERRQDQQEQQEHAGSSRPDANAARDRARAVLAAPLRQVAVARHIRTVFVPTVSHLRAFLSAFSSEADPASKAQAPPTDGPSALDSKMEEGEEEEEGEDAASRKPLLLLYGLLELHRDTSEWNAQGLGTTAACMIEAAHISGMEAVVVEPKTRVTRKVDDQGNPEGEGRVEDVLPAHLDAMLSEEMPVLNLAARKLGRDGEGLGWTGRTVPVKRVLGRWFCFRDGPWDAGRETR